MEKTHSILIIDDEHSIVEIVSIILKNAGYEVTADPGAEMLFLKTGLNPDLILLDNQIGGKSGALMCLDLKQNERTRGIPVILVSATDDLKSLAQQACADDFLTKPFSIKPLLQKIEMLLSKNTVAC